MDHGQAVQLQACEKYLLGELTPDLRDAYEEHYFSCAECATQLRSAAEFVNGSRRLLREPSAADYVRPPRGWFPWMSPWVVGPVLAALLLFIGYQNIVTIPHYQRSAATRVLPMYSLIAANTRGDEGLVFSVPPNQPFGLYVDVPYDPSFSTYLLRLESPSGSSRFLRSLTAAEAQKTQVIAVNPGAQAGKYTIIVSGLANPFADISSAKELARLQFTVELRN
jgi:hypothetical protein